MNRVVRLDYAYGVCPRCGSRDKLRYLIRQDGMTHKPYEVKCINCNSYFTREDVGLQPKPQTNADCIRAKTAEELAEFINDLFYGLHDNPGMCDVCDRDSVQNCKQCWLDWLRQEVIS